MHPGRFPFRAVPSIGCLAVLLAAVSAPAQTPARPGPAPGPVSAGAPSDSALSALKDPLLPAVLGPGERLLWGERGWMRSLAGLPLNEESREKEMGIRRTLLTLHQVGGFATLAAMIATAYSGQMILDGHRGWEEPKEILAWTTVGLYFTTATLALLAPPPVIRRPGFNSVTLHKSLAWIHFTGMMVTPLLGMMIEDDRDLKVYHQVAGYATTAVFAGAMLTVTFF